MQDGELLAHDPADVEQRLGDRRQPRKARDEVADPRLVSRATDDAGGPLEVPFGGRQSINEIGWNFRPPQAAAQRAEDAGLSNGRRPPRSSRARGV